MTCIVGIETDDGAWVGADSFVGSGVHRMLHPGSKVVALTQCASVVIATSGSLRLRQIVQHDVALPTCEVGETPERWAHRFVRAIRDGLGAEGALHQAGNEDRTSDGGSSGVILCYRGRLFEIGNDFAVIPAAPCGYMADGSGWQYALGALHATASLDPETRIRRALEAAAEHCPTVAGPFDVRFVPRPPGDTA